MKRFRFIYSTICIAAAFWLASTILVPAVSADAEDTVDNARAVSPQTCDADAGRLQEAKELLEKGGHSGPVTDIRLKRLFVDQALAILRTLPGDDAHADLMAGLAHRITLARKKADKIRFCDELLASYDPSRTPPAIARARFAAKEKERLSGNTTAMALLLDRVIADTPDAYIKASVLYEKAGRTNAAVDKSVLLEQALALAEGSPERRFTRLASRILQDMAKAADSADEKIRLYDRVALEYPDDAAAALWDKLDLTEGKENKIRILDQIATLCMEACTRNSENSLRLALAEKCRLLGDAACLVEYFESGEPGTSDAESSNNDEGKKSRHGCHPGNNISWNRLFIPSGYHSTPERKRLILRAFFEAYKNTDSPACRADAGLACIELAKLEESDEAKDRWYSEAAAVLPPPEDEVTAMFWHMLFYGRLQVCTDAAEIEEVRDQAIHLGAVHRFNDSFALLGKAVAAPDPGEKMHLLDTLLEKSPSVTPDPIVLDAKLYRAELTGDADARAAIYDDIIRTFRLHPVQAGLQGIEAIRLKAALTGDDLLLERILDGMIAEGDGQVRLEARFLKAEYILPREEKLHFYNSIFEDTVHSTERHMKNIAIRALLEKARFVGEEEKGELLGAIEELLDFSGESERLMTASEKLRQARTDTDSAQKNACYDYVIDNLPTAAGANMVLEAFQEKRRLLRQF